MYAQLFEKQGKMQAAEFVRSFVNKVPYKIHKILTDNGARFTHLQQHSKTLSLWFSDNYLARAIFVVRLTPEIIAVFVKILSVLN